MGINCGESSVVTAEGNSNCLIVSTHTGGGGRSVDLERDIDATYFGQGQMGVRCRVYGLPPAECLRWSSAHYASRRAHERTGSRSDYFEVSAGTLIKVLVSLVRHSISRSELRA